MNAVTVLNWNLERRAPPSWQAREMMERIRQSAPDVLCMTEAHVFSAAELGGYSICSEGEVSWSTRLPQERLAVLWSREPWRSVIHPDEPALSGGCVAGLTDTAVGPLMVVGICTPHHFATPLSADTRAPLWREHIAYFQGLKRLLASLSSDQPLIVVGDFNQRIPWTWGSHAAFAAMQGSLFGLRVATAGEISGPDALTIDHTAHTPDLSADWVRGVSATAENGRRLSDHFGVITRLGMP